jgi:hypothetical protein
VSPDSGSFPWHIEGNTVFHIAAWQLLFIAGLAIGWHRGQLESLLSHVRRPVVFIALTALSVTVIALYVAQLTVLDTLRENATIASLFFEKQNVPAGRFAIFALLITFAFTFTTLFWEPVKGLTGWLLMPFGQNSLTAYSIHIYIVAIVTYFAPRLLGDQSQLIEWRTTLQVMGVSVIWLAIVLLTEMATLVTQLRARFTPVQLFSDRERNEAAKV